MKKPKKNVSSRQRARQRRNNESRRRATSRRKERSAPEREEPALMMLQSEFDGSEPHFHDDCPQCRAMAEVGIEPNSPVTMEQYERMCARMMELIAEEGMPDGGSILVTKDGRLQTLSFSDLMN